MPFPVPSRQTLHDEGLSDYAASQPNKSVARGSTPYLLLRAISGLIWMFLARLLFLDKERLPDTASRAGLDRWGEVYLFPAKGAVGAQRALALRVTGTVGAPVTNGASLTHADGTRYQIAQVGASIGGGGFVDVGVAAISTGLATNKIAGEVLTFSAPPVNVNAVATLVLNLTGGADAEGTEPYRGRLISHLGDPPQGGAVPDYIEWALSVPGNETAYVWKNRRGQGTIDVAVLGPGHGSARQIADLQPTQDYLDDMSRRPANVKDVLVLVTPPQSQAVRMRIAIDETKYRWDWIDDGFGYAVTAANIGLSQITVPTAPSEVVAGVRITVNGEEATVTTRAGNVLTLSFANDRDDNPVTWFVANPVGSNMRASGDLITPVRNAILDLFDRLGPARDDRYAMTQWESAFQTDSAITAARNVIGCIKAAMISPTSDVVPVDPLNGSTSVPYLVPGNVEIVKL